MGSIVELERLTHTLCSYVAVGRKGKTQKHTAKEIAAKHKAAKGAGAAGGGGSGLAAEWPPAKANILCPICKVRKDTIRHSIRTIRYVTAALTDFFPPCRFANLRKIAEDSLRQ